MSAIELVEKPQMAEPVQGGGFAQIVVAGERLVDQLLKLRILEELEPFQIGDGLWIRLSRSVAAISRRSLHGRALILLPSSESLKQT